MSEFDLDINNVIGSSVLASNFCSYSKFWEYISSPPRLGLLWSLSNIIKWARKVTGLLRMVGSEGSGSSRGVTCRQLAGLTYIHIQIQRDFPKCKAKNINNYIPTFSSQIRTGCLLYGRTTTKVWLSSHLHYVSTLGLHTVMIHSYVTEELCRGFVGLNESGR